MGLCKSGELASSPEGQQASWLEENRERIMSLCNLASSPEDQQASWLEENCESVIVSP